MENDGLLRVMLGNPVNSEGKCKQSEMQDEEGWEGVEEKVANNQELQ